VQTKQEQGRLENADKEVCMMLLHEVMPALKSTATRLEEALTGAELTGSSPRAAATVSTKQQASQQDAPSEQAKGSSQVGQGTTGDQASGKQPQPPAAPNLPPVDSMLLLMMTAARTLKVAVHLSCSGQHCTCCGMWEAYGSGSGKRSSGGSTCSNPAVLEPNISNQAGPDHRLAFEPALRETEVVEAALGALLSLADSLCHEVLHREAVAHHPLLYLQALLSTVHVSVWCTTSYLSVLLKTQQWHYGRRIQALPCIGMRCAELHPFGVGDCPT
jgi:hypothetical protein